MKFRLKVYLKCDLTQFIIHYFIIEGKNTIPLFNGKNLAQGAKIEHEFITNDTINISFKAVGKITSGEATVRIEIVQPEPTIKILDYTGIVDNDGKILIDYEYKVA